MACLDFSRLAQRGGGGGGITTEWLHMVRDGLDTLALTIAVP
jgi:hypothetical protein